MRPLHYGSWQGHDGLVELLLLHGSDVNQPASDGNSPLHLASEHGHFCVVSTCRLLSANQFLQHLLDLSYPVLSSCHAAIQSFVILGHCTGLSD